MYYLMKYDSPPEGSGYMRINDGRHYKSFMNWRVGRMDAAIPPESVVIEVEPFDGYTGNPPEISDMGVPLMSDRLRNAIVEAGVDNIIFHPVTLKNKGTGERYAYYAFKIVGLVSASDMAGGTDIESYDGDYVGDSSVKNLVLDDSKLHGFLLFRLAEKFSAILIEEKVRDHILSCGIDTLKFMEPKDYYAL